MVVFCLGEIKLMVVSDGRSIYLIKDTIDKGDMVM